MKKNAGMTLIEVVIASAILVLIFYMTMDILFSAARTATDGSISSKLEERGRAYVDRCKIEFLTAKFANVNSAISPGFQPGIFSFSYCQIGFVIPVDRDTTGTIKYGYTSKVGQPDPSGVGKYCYIRYEPYKAIRESSAAAIGYQMYPVYIPYPYPALPTLPTLGPDQNIIANFDVNRDGDLTDTFAVGRITKYVMKPNGTADMTEDLSDFAIMPMAHNHPPTACYYMDSAPVQGGMDGSTATSYVEDMMFQYVDKGGYYVGSSGSPPANAEGIRVTVWHGSFDDRMKTFFLRKNTETIKFRNQ